MADLRPIFRALPPVLLVYGLVNTIAGIAALRASVSEIASDSTLMSGVRVTYLAGIVHSLDPLFFYSAMAALVFAANSYWEKD